MSEIVICCSSRAERGPLESVIAALPEAKVVGMLDEDQLGRPHDVMARGLAWFTEQFEHHAPKLVILLGDRYETLAAALAATFLRIPVAHIHGGETTTGAFDDAFRDSITRMAALHFVATTGAAERVMALQGYPGPGCPHYKIVGVHLVGAPGLDGVAGNSAKRDHKRVLVTYHPETRAADYGISGCHAMLEAIRTTLLGYEIIFCGVNNDPGCEEIREAIKNHCMKHGGMIHNTTDHARYIDHMQHAAVCIGNSSALVIECPWVGVPSVNIGMRQDGRPMANSVFQSRYGSVTETQAAIKSALMFKKTPEPLYTGSGVGLKIAEVVREYVR